MEVTEQAILNSLWFAQTVAGRDGVFWRGCGLFGGGEGFSVGGGGYEVKRMLPKQVGLKPFLPGFGTRLFDHLFPFVRFRLDF